MESKSMNLLSTIFSFEFIFDLIYYLFIGGVLVFFTYHIFKLIFEDIK